MVDRKTRDLLDEIATLKRQLNGAQSEVKLCELALEGDRKYQAQLHDEIITKGGIIATMEVALKQAENQATKDRGYIKLLEATLSMSMARTIKADGDAGGSMAKAFVEARVGRA